MTAIAFPDLDHSILSRRDEIIAGLAALLPRECLVTSDDERRAFETDALTAYRRLPLAVKLVLFDGTIVEIGGDHLDSGGLDLLGLMIGSEGQLGIVTEATVRILRSAEGARPVLFGFPTSEEAGACVADIIGHGIIPVAMEFMDKLAIEICEAFAHAGYPLDAGALLIIEVEGSEEEMETQLGKIVEIAKKHGVMTVRESKSAMETAAIWKGRKSAFGATGRIADYICMDGTVPTGQLSRVLAGTEKIVKSYGLRVANVFHAGDGNTHPR